MYYSTYVLGTVPRVSRSCDNFSDGFDLHLLLLCQNSVDPAGGFGRAAGAFRCHRYDRVPSLVHLGDVRTAWRLARKRWLKTVGCWQGFLAGLLVLSGAIATTVFQVWFTAGKPPVFLVALAGVVFVASTVFATLA